MSDLLGTAARIATTSYPSARKAPDMARRIAVFGTGYLGATHAACMAELGHEVLGVDVDLGKLAKLSAGEAPFYEPGLDKVLKKNIDAGRLRFTRPTARQRSSPTCTSSPSQRHRNKASLQRTCATSMR